MEDTNRKILHGAFWTLLARIVDRGLGLVSTLVLVRLLTPDDFGVMALAVGVVSFLKLMSDFGFSTVLIHKQDMQKYHYDTVWTIRLIILTLVGIIGLLAADKVAIFFDDDRVSAVVKCLSALILLRSIQNIGVVDFTKQLRFQLLFWAGFSRKILTFTVTISMAYYIQSYWALVVGMITGAIFSNVFSHFAHPYRPALSLKAIHEMAAMSGWLFFNNILKYLSNNTPKLMAGKLLGISSAGFLNVADEVVNVPTTELISAINKSTLSGYALKQADREDLRETYLKVVSFIALTAFPACLGIWVVAEPLVYVALGEAWVETIPVIQWLAISYLLLSLMSNMGSLNMAIGQPKLSVWINLVRLIVLIPAIYLLYLKSGLVGISQGIFLSACASYMMALIVQIRMLNIKLSSYLGIVFRPAIAALAMVSLLLYLRDLWLGGQSNYIVLVGMIAIGVVVYFLSVAILWFAMRRPEGVERLMIDLSYTYWWRIKRSIS